MNVYFMTPITRFYFPPGNGDVIEPSNGIIAIGSGGSYALAAARALIDFPELDAMQVI